MDFTNNEWETLLDRQAWRFRYNSQLQTLVFEEPWQNEWKVTESHELVSSRLEAWQVVVRIETKLDWSPIFGQLDAKDKTLHLLRGVPGVGKTTLGESIAPGLVFSADDCPGLYDGGYHFVMQAASHQWNARRVEEAMKAGVGPLCVANTSMQLKYYQKYLDLREQYGYAASIWTGEGLILPDGTLAKSIHDVPTGMLLRQRTQYEPYVHKIKPNWLSYSDPNNPACLRVFDKDGTLVFNPQGGIPTLGEQQPIPGMQKKIQGLKAAGDIITVVTNQAGLVTKNRETGEFYKTPESLVLEFIELLMLFPEIDLILACPDYDGDRLLIFKPGDTRFLEIKGEGIYQPFRKPGAGSYQYALEHFSGAFGHVAAVGNSREDKLAAMAADIPYKHVHDWLYG
jgi:histidinol phosphatase-like enzyme